jgi:ubiquinol-cytochrome c reductase iron-sulfur subunit
MRRRKFLYCTTAAVGGGGLIAALWPFLDQMNPDAAVRAAGDIVEVSLVDLRPDQQRIVHWHNWPIFVVKRTAKMLDALHEQKFASTLVDPHSEGRQQPAYAKNWHRSINPEYAVLVGVCTYC